MKKKTKELITNATGAYGHPLRVTQSQAQKTKWSDPFDPKSGKTGLLHLVLPLPVSVNERMIRSAHSKSSYREIGGKVYKFGGRAQFILSHKYRDYLDMARVECRKQQVEQKWSMVSPTYEQPLVIKICVWLPNKQRDATNILKPLLDVMSGMIYNDDKWILPQFEKIIIDKKNPHVEVVI